MEDDKAAGDSRVKNETDNMDNTAEERLLKKLENKITVLKNTLFIQLKQGEEMFKETFELEKKVHDQCQELYEKRRLIVSGELEPEPQEQQWPQLNESDDSDECPDESCEQEALPPDTEGIPYFWVTVLQSISLTRGMIHADDILALEHLTDIQLSYTDKHSYKLLFHFSTNEWFSNSVLTKQYFWRAKVDDTNPFAFTGSEIYHSQGCEINWLKNLTERTMPSMDDNLSTELVEMAMPCSSFFSFFSCVDETDDEIQKLDFELGEFFRLRIIPRAIFFYTGESVEDEAFSNMVSHSVPMDFLQRSFSQTTI